MEKQQGFYAFVEMYGILEKTGYFSVNSPLRPRFSFSVESFEFGLA
jgi:hypothetical protein